MNLEKYIEKELNKLDKLYKHDFVQGQKYALENVLTQLRLHVVGSSLPTKEEISLELKQIAHWDKVNGCPENQKQAYKYGFMHGIEFKRTKGKSDM